MIKPNTETQKITLSAERRARSLNHADTQKNRAIIATITDTLQLLAFFRAPTAAITTNSRYIKETAELYDLISDIETVLNIIRNTLFANLGSDETGNINRTDTNISNLSNNVQDATARIVSLISVIPPFNIERNTKESVPTLKSADLGDRTILKRTLEEMSRFLHNFIERNRINVVHDAAKATNEFTSHQQILDGIQERAMVEEAFDDAFSTQLNDDWHNTLAKLTLTLATFRNRLDSIHKPTAEDLILLIDEKTLSDRIARDAENERKLHKQINRKDRIASILPVRIMTKLYESLTGVHLLPWSSPERATLAKVGTRIDSFAKTIKQRRAIRQRRTDNQ